MLQDNLQSTGHAGLTGVFDVLGDKSVSHRSLIFGGLAIGVREYHGEFVAPQPPECPYLRAH